MQFRFRCYRSPVDRSSRFVLIVGMVEVDSSAVKRTFVFSALLISAVGSAARPSQAPAPTTNATASSTHDSFNRNCTGTSSKKASIGRRCGTHENATFRAGNGSVIRRISPGKVSEAILRPDGSVTAQSGKARMLCTIRDGHMKADLSTDNCSFDYKLMGPEVV